MTKSLDKQGQLLIDLSQYNASREELYRLRRTIDDLNRAPAAYQKWADMAEMFSKWRLFPRLFFSVYMVVFLHIINWAMSPRCNDNATGHSGRFHCWLGDCNLRDLLRHWRNEERMKNKTKCPVCSGRGLVRMHWNERWWPRAATTIARYKDEWCKRCKGKGKVKE